MRAPRLNGINPATIAAASSSDVRPPSGPTSNVTEEIGGGAKKSRNPFFAPGESTKLKPDDTSPVEFSRALICAPHQAESDVIDRTCGMRFLPHCSHAEIATCCQCRTRFSALSPESLI